MEIKKKKKKSPIFRQFFSFQSSSNYRCFSDNYSQQLSKNLHFQTNYEASLLFKTKSIGSRSSTIIYVSNYCLSCELNYLTTLFTIIKEARIQIFRDPKPSNLVSIFLLCSISKILSSCL
jgi:hypothetical protein